MFEEKLAISTKCIVGSQMIKFRKHKYNLNNFNCVFEQKKWEREKITFEIFAVCVVDQRTLLSRQQSCDMNLIKKRHNATLRQTENIHGTRSEFGSLFQLIENIYSLQLQTNFID